MIKRKREEEYWTKFFPSASDFSRDNAPAIKCQGQVVEGVSRSLI